MNNPATLTPAIAESLVAWTNQVASGDDAPIPAVCPVEYLPAMQVFADGVKNRGTRARKTQRKAIAKQYENNPVLSEIINGTYMTRLVDAPIRGLSRDNCAISEEARKRLKPLILDYASRKQKGIAELIAAAYPNEILYVTAMKAFYFWQNPIWVRDDIQLIPLIVSTHILDLFYEEYNAVSAKNKALGTIDDSDTANRALRDKYVRAMKSLEKCIGTLQSKSGRDGAIDYAKTYLAISGNELDAQLKPHELPAKSDIVDLDTGKARPAQPLDYLTVTMPTRYSIGSLAPRFQQFLNEIWQDIRQPERMELIAFMQRLLGYSLLAENREAVFPIFWGSEGRNGKDVLLSVIKAVLGDLAGDVVNDVVIDFSKGRTSGGASPHLMLLRGKRIAWASEPEQGAKLSEGTVKHLTGSPEITARTLNRDYVTWKPTHTLILVTNPRPHIKANDSAIWERVLLIPFNMRFVENPDPEKPNEKKKDSSLKATLQEEKEGVLAWLVEGYQEYKRVGLNPPALVKAATKEYREQEDTLGIFLSECIEKCEEKEGTVTGSVFYTVYKNWATENGIKPMSGVTFGQEMKTRFIHKMPANKSTYYGLRLAQSNQKDF